MDRAAHYLAGNRFTCVCVVDVVCSCSGTVLRCVSSFQPADGEMGKHILTCSTDSVCSYSDTHSDTVQLDCRMNDFKQTIILDFLVSCCLLKRTSSSFTISAERKTTRGRLAVISLLVLFHYLPLWRCGSVPLGRLLFVEHGADLNPV